METEIARRCDELLREVQCVLCFDQPLLQCRVAGSGVLVEGSYLLDEVSNPVAVLGPIATFGVRVFFECRYPEFEPIVFEIGGKIPWVPDRHINSNGTCCITVWEAWLARTHDHSVSAYFDGPFREFFLSQHFYSTCGEWAFGEWAHGSDGYLAACAEALGIPGSGKTRTVAYLEELSTATLKARRSCPCGSGRQIRDCHRDRLIALRQSVGPGSARRILNRLEDEPS